MPNLDADAYKVEILRMIFQNFEFFSDSTRRWRSETSQRRQKKASSAIGKCQERFWLKFCIELGPTTSFQNATAFRLIVPVTNRPVHIIRLAEKIGL